MFDRAVALSLKLLASLLIVHLFIIGLADPIPAAEAVVLDGVPHVRNGAQPRDGSRTLKLAEAWRVGGDDDEAFFGLIPRVCADPDGNVYVLDSQLCQVSMYDRDGELVRVMFREGEGPGEVRQPRDMLLLADGRVGLIQEFPGVMVMVDGEGLPAGRMDIAGTAGGVHALASCQGAGDLALLTGTHMSRNTPGVSDRDYFLESYTPEGELQARFAAHQAQYDFNDFLFSERQHMPPFWFSFAVAGDGTVYTAHERDDYAITAHAPDGTPRLVIERAYEPLQRSQREQDNLYGMIESAMSGIPGDFRIEVEKQEAAVAYLARGLQIAPDGRLWVLSGRGLRPTEPGIMAVFDVFEPDGTFAEQVALEAPHRGTEVGIVMTGQGRVLVVEGYFESLAAQFGNGSTYSGDGEEPAPPAVVCYDIVR